MKIELWGIGKTKIRPLNEAEDLFRNRIKHYCKFSHNYFNPVKNASSLPSDVLIKEETKMILSQLKKGDYLILLDERGKQYNSVELSKKLERWMNQSYKRIIFLIGGAYGFDQTLRLKANEKLSLSSMTFSHQLIRTIFLEQLYRAFTIINNESYHNE